MYQKRIEEIDILKALAIICMVAGHSSAPFTKYIYLFHMAVFFIASGFFYKDSSSDSLENVKIVIWKRIKQLWMPAFVWNAIFILLNNVFIRLNIYTDNAEIFQYLQGQHLKTHQFMTIRQMIRSLIKGLWFGIESTEGGAFWFLKILFMVSVGYVVCDYFIKRLFFKNPIAIQCVISAVLLLFGFFCYQRGISLKGIELMSSCYCLYYLGYILNLASDKYKHLNAKVYVLVFLSSFLLLSVLNNFGSIELSHNSYTNPLFLLAASFGGWWLLYSASYFLKQTKIKGMMTVIGKKTLSIVILHFVCMKPVALLVCLYYQLPLFCMAKHPNVYGNVGLWWIVYTLAGTLIPIGLSILYDNLLRKRKRVGG